MTELSIGEFPLDHGKQQFSEVFQQPQDAIIHPTNFRMLRCLFTIGVSLISDCMLFCIEKIVTFLIRNHAGFKESIRLVDFILCIVALMISLVTITIICIFMRRQT